MTCPPTLPEAYLDRVASNPDPSETIPAYAIGLGINKAIIGIGKLRQMILQHMMMIDT